LRTSALNIEQFKSAAFHVVAHKHKLDSGIGRRSITELGVTQVSSAGSTGKAIRRTEARVASGVELLFFAVVVRTLLDEIHLNQLSNIDRRTMHALSLMDRQQHEHYQSINQSISQSELFKVA